MTAGELFLRDVIDIPESVRAGDFTVELSGGFVDTRARIAEYVVTEQLRQAFGAALGIVRAAVRAAVRTGSSHAAYLHGSFGSGKSHAVPAAAGLLLLWSRGYVEPVVPPPQPRHIVAQQVLALCLQNGTVGRALWHREWNGLAPFDRSADPIIGFLLAEGFLEQDGELLFIGPQAEAKFGRRHFLAMTAVFTAPPQFTVLSGRHEIGRTDSALLVEKVDGPRLLLLAGRS